MTDDPEFHAEVDAREPDPLGVSEALYEYECIVDTKLNEMPAGDICIGRVGFERKTPSDYASSLTEGRLDEQVAKMGDNYDHAYILVEGSLSDLLRLEHTRLMGTSIRGSVASITARDNGVNAVLFVDDEENLIDLAVRLALKHDTDPTTRHLPPDELGSDVATDVKMYAQIDGVGPETAEALAIAFDSPKDCIVAGPSTYQFIEGIGPKTAQNIHEAFR